MAAIVINIPAGKQSDVDDFMATQYGGTASLQNTTALILDYVWGAVDSVHVRRKGTEAAKLNPVDFGDLKPNRP